MLWFSLLLFAQRFQLAVMFVWRCLLFLYFSQVAKRRSGCEAVIFVTAVYGSALVNRSIRPLAGGFPLCVIAIENLLDSDPHTPAQNWRSV